MENVMGAGEAHSEKPDKQAGHHEILVSITVDGTKFKIPSKTYLVSELKAATEVPADKELDQVKQGVLSHLSDDSSIKIHGHEAFISHQRTGGAS